MFRSFSRLFLLMTLFISGCGLDPFIPMTPCSHGSALPKSKTLTESCKLSVKKALKETVLDGFIAMTDDSKILFQWGETSAPTNIASVRKSIIALLYGIAIERKMLDLNATLEDLGVDDSKNPLSSSEKKATIRDLLSARSGIYIPPLGESSDWRRLRPKRNSHAPGTYWFYNNWDFNALGTIFKKKTGLSLHDAIEKWLAIPLGMQTYCPEHMTYESADFTEHQMYRLYMSTEDLARIGVLVMQKGKWQGKQIVPQKWIEQMIKPISNVRTLKPTMYYTHYGFLWWRDEKGHIWADGAGGNFIHIDPKKKLVTVAQNRTGVSIPGYLWGQLVQKSPETLDQVKVHDALEACR